MSIRSSDNLVFFDFDGTLTTRDTILPLGLYLGRFKPRRHVSAAHLFSLLILLKLRLITNDRFKQRFAHSILRGESRDRIDELARRFAEAYVTPILKDRVVRQLRNHHAAGDEIYIVSSNFDFLLRSVRDYLKADGVIATEPEVVSDRYTGRLGGPACDGPQKLARVLARFGSERVRHAAAYGDSAGDRPLLEFVKTAVWV